MSNIAKIWQGRQDHEDGIAGDRWFQRVRFESTNDSKLGLVGYASDKGVINNKGRAGALHGPNALRTQLANLPWLHDFVFTDAGNVEGTSDLSSGQQQYAAAISQQLASQNFVLGIGGGHDIAYGSYLGVADHCQSQAKDLQIGILNLDAHFDLRKPSPHASSGTPFRQIAQDCQRKNHAFHYTCIGISPSANTRALFDYAKEFNVDFVTDVQCDWPAIKRAVDNLIERVDVLYVTLCLDVFPASIAPGVSAPAALGLDPKLAITIFHYIADKHHQGSVHWPLVDVAELNPRFDIDERTAKLASRMIFEIVNARF